MILYNDPNGAAMWLFDTDPDKRPSPYIRYDYPLTGYMMVVRNPARPLTWIGDGNIATEEQLRSLIDKIFAAKQIVRRP